MPGKFPRTSGSAAGTKPARSGKSGAKSSKAKPVKSLKADGTPKKRWTPAERATKGLGPRRGGGQPRSTRRTDATGDGPRRDRSTGFRRDVDPRSPREVEDRPTRGFDRDSRPTRTVDREDRPNRRFDRGDRPDDRPARSFDRDDRPARSTNRDDRPARPWERPDRSDQPDRRDDRPARSFDRDDRPARSTNRDDRPARSYDRSDRPARSFDRSDRPARSFDRDDRPARSTNRDDRPARSYDRSDRPARSFDRPDRPARSFDRPDRPARSFDRPDRPARSFDRPDRRDDRSRGSYDRDDRSNRGGGEHQRPARRTEFTPRGSAVISRIDRPVRPRTTEPVPGATTFAQLGLPASLVDTLTRQGITTPFPIQAATIPDALTGRDVLGRGQTGSGKTLAFGLPMITGLSGADSSLPRGLVLVPTRELAMQVLDALNPLARVAGLSMVLVAGGMSYTPQLRAFATGVDIVVATPGRLIDLMDQNAVDLTRVEVTVLDEADHMADLGFMPAVTQILDTIPHGGQRLLFSATLDRAIDRLVRAYLVDPVTHEVDSGQASVTTMEHFVLYTAPKDKTIMTAEIASRPGRTLVFVRTQRGADRVAEQLRGGGVMAGALHGGLAQGARTRILAAFKDGQVPVLVATDVAARGIHVDEVGLVLQVDPPGGPKEYLHRAGRTARAGGTGVVVTLALPHQRREITSLTGQAGVRPATLPAESNHPDLRAATGSELPSGRPIAEADYERIISPPQARRRPGGDRPRGRGSRDGSWSPRRSGGSRARSRD